MDAPTKAVEVDTELGAIYARQINVTAKLSADELHLIRMAGGIRREGWKQIVEITVDEALDRGPQHKHEVSSWERVVARREELLAENDVNMLRADVLNLEWVKAGFWSRFFLVRNANGHIHSSLHCSTCYPTTEFAWLPELSGLTEVDAVESQGAILCSVCFPSAPVEWTNGVSKADQQAKAERAAAKAEREAKKLAKALLPDGSPLRLSDGDKLQTIVAAKQWLTRCASWNTHKRDEAGADDLQRVLEALAAKTCDDVKTIWAAAKKRAAR
jgi:hypothetical protein